ncbi:MAG: hypothetical protein HeimAB125_02130 [Candidatus Heimdallarchaeota archaeon AB_125]|nr:MAG: hypothetical protein HeimAB125_02130 [Candidatus Heimdallarchaeota archaeon AB_125]
MVAMRKLNAFIYFFQPIVFHEYINEFKDSNLRYMNLCDELEEISKHLELDSNPPEIIERLRILSYNYKSNNNILLLIDKLIKKCKKINDFVSLISLYSLKITHLHHLRENLDIVTDLILEIKILSDKNNYIEGLALHHNHKWFIEKFQGNRDQAEIEINEALKLINSKENPDQFIYHLCKYTFAIELWIEHHDSKAATMLEECVPYFLERGLNRSIAQILGTLCVIYQINNNHKKAVKTVEKILRNRDFMKEIAVDTKSIVYYLAGVGQLLQSNLKNANGFLNESLTIFERNHTSIYYNYYFIRILLHIATIQALTGNWDLAYKNICKIEQLLQDENYVKNFDNHSMKYIPHSINLIRFYVYSRLQNFEVNMHKELIESIYSELENQYSNPILLIEYLLNSDLKEENLEKLVKSNFAILRRVKHIIEYQIKKKQPESSVSKNEKSQFRIQILMNRERNIDETYLEKAFTDLLLAKELFIQKRYEEIHLLLKKYENRLDKLEVLEFRIFMEAFIQVGAFKTGDPLGPALQYMAIKKCRQYGFSRLENKLSDYLTMQGNDTIRAMM